MPDALTITTGARVTITAGRIPSSSGGSGTTDHAALSSNLAWATSGHTGTASRLAGFSGAGAAAYYAIGTDVLAYDAGLTSLATVDTAGDLLPYTTGANAWAATSITAAGRAILDDANASAQRTTLGLVIGTDVQAYGADITAIEALTGTGFPARTADDTWAMRSIAVSGAGGLSVSNPAGVAGNPTITLADATATASGAVRARTLRSGGYYGRISTGGNSSAAAVTANRLYADLHDIPVAATEYTGMLYEQTVASGAGTRTQLLLYTTGSDGNPDALIWYSGSIASDGANEIKSVLFSAGTWVDTTWKNGNNLKIPPGRTLYRCLWCESTPTVRMLSTGLQVGWQHVAVSAALSQPQANYLYVSSAFGVTPPSSFGAPTGPTSNVSMPIIDLIAA